MGYKEAESAYAKGLSLRESACLGGMTVEELGERMLVLVGARAGVKGELMQSLIEMGMGGDRRACEVAIGLLGGVEKDVTAGAVAAGYRELDVKVLRKQVKELARVVEDAEFEEVRDG